MEFLSICIPILIAVYLTKPNFMVSRSFLNRLIIFGFVVLVGFSLAKAINAESTLGVILALTSLGAVICFLLLVAKTNEEMKKEKIR